MSVARHTTYNLLGSLVPIAVSLVTIPLYLKVIGVDRYGLLAIFWTLLGFFGFVSLGMGPAVTQRLAAMAERSESERSQLVWTALAVALGMAAIGSLLIIVVAHFYFSLLSETPEGLRAEVAGAIPWLAAALPVSLASGVFAGALQGRRKFGLLNIINSVTTIAMALVPLAVGYFLGPNLAGLAVASTAVNFVMLLVLWRVASGAVPLTRPRRPASSMVHHLVAYGSWTTGTTLLGPVVANLDRFVIGALLGPAAVSAYVIPYNLAQRIVMLPASLSNALMPRYASADPKEVGRLQESAITMLAASLTPMAVIAIALCGPFLNWWIGTNLASVAAPVGVILIAAFWIHGIAYVSSTMVMGLGRPDLLTKLLMVELIPYVIVLYALTDLVGAPGAAVAWALKSACDPALFLFTRPSRKSLARLLVNAAIVLAALGAGLLLSWTSPLYWLALLGLLGFAFFLGWQTLSYWFDRGLTSFLELA